MRTIPASGVSSRALQKQIKTYFQQNRTKNTRLSESGAIIDK
jgi:hypothetical protein